METRRWNIGHRLARSAHFAHLRLRHVYSKVGLEVMRAIARHSSRNCAFIVLTKANLCPQKREMRERVAGSDRRDVVLPFVRLPIHHDHGDAVQQYGCSVGSEAEELYSGSPQLQPNRVSISRALRSYGVRLKKKNHFFVFSAFAALLHEITGEPL